MTDQTPEPDTADPQANAAERLGGSIQAEAVYERQNYPGEMTGPGRWVTIQTHGEDLGIVWTNGVDGIGFIATTHEGRIRTPDFVRAFQNAATVGVPVTDVYDYWANLGGLGLAALPEQEGDLDTLNR